MKVPRNNFLLEAFLQHRSWVKGLYMLFIIILSKMLIFIKNKCKN